MSPPKMPGTTQKRAGRGRSKTGCRTCRARRIKCDETPVACRNCISTGRQCDGYDAHRLPPKAKGLPKNGLDLPACPGWPEDGFGRAMTSDEKRCFSHFQFRTIPTLLEFFDSALWQKLVLQLSRSEPPVYHAIVALSALHQVSEANGMPLATPATCAEGNVWHQFAEDQLRRSIKLLNQRSTSQDPHLRQVILVCCLLFVLADLLRGLYESAFTHLRGGLRVLKELQMTGRGLDSSSSASRSGLVGQSLFSTFAHLDSLAAHYDRVFPMLTSRGQPLADQEKVHAAPGRGLHDFRTLREARVAFDSLLSASYRFSAMCMGMAEAEVLLRYDELQQHQIEVWSKTVKFKQVFLPFYTNIYDQLSPKEQRGADIIRLHILSLPICLQTCLLGKNRSALAYFTSDLETVCSMVEAIMTKFPERPSFTVETGVIPPLYLSAILCCDYSVRWRAIQLLRSWPHREGPFDSNWCASLAEEALRLELHARIMEDAGFREARFVLPNVDEISANDMLGKLVYIRQQKLNMLVKSGRIGHASENAIWDPLDAVGSVKGMHAWSCVRAFNAVTSRIPEVKRDENFPKTNTVD
ncbi:Zn(II)2Cys6 transcription factor [Aspergillus clavatus NRRL 1]|uniref:C6 zinc finger domain protein n=1 Tax=Aspergillus clavatus (strain ATCC 1007 / CBS 513.65 / DSM 816 / NCTC 3887 / NRRL 1 / QM 1276 / 107) TaxID=344612 RepID=A1C5A0_ASPCL|nr:C6 zinc finger domain protein [Aspergillus clavatus NRRL 1]EAW14868.1 C6 zinc finger domain protein [Aspergillus clavatus NRRL 1]